MLYNDPSAARYPVDPNRRDLIEEFRRNPRGPHSEDLQKVLHRMRWAGVAGRYVLVTLEPGKKWMLGRLPAKRGGRIQTFPDKIYTSPLAAEWDIFCLRWEALTGQKIEA
ncbi:MAG: hypothetical protein ABW003_15670 [Microvirga sp.]